jgi:hypothetical protein
MLLVSNVFYGPSWPQIHKCLEHLVPSPTLLTLGSTPAVLLADSSGARELIAGLFASANTARGKQVHLEGVGFVELDSKAKLELKQYVLPALSILCVVVLSVFWGNSQQLAQSTPEVPVTKGCIVDSSRSEFERWLSESLSVEGKLRLGQEVQKSTDQGQLNIVVESVIGSAAKVTGAAVCLDGTQRVINHRLHSSGSGAALELGQ